MPRPAATDLTAVCEGSAKAAAWMGVVSPGSSCPLLALSQMPASCPSREKTRSLGRLPGLVYERESHLYCISFRRGL